MSKSLLKKAYKKKIKTDILMLQTQNYFKKSYDYFWYEGFLKTSLKYTILSTQLIIASVWPICTWQFSLLKQQTGQITQQYNLLQNNFPYQMIVSLVAQEVKTRQKFIMKWRLGKNFSG